MKKLGLALLTLAIIFSGCSYSIVPQNSNSIKLTQQTNSNQASIRPEIKANIDKLKDYDIVDIEHMTKGIEEPQKLDPEFPKVFKAGMLKVTFQKKVEQAKDQVSVVCQTEEKVGHLTSVIPGKTVVDGYIFYTGTTDRDDIPKLIRENSNLKFSKEEEKYFIEQLYQRFGNKMTSSQANLVNQTKDFALAIYFNGNQGIEQFHQEQKSN